MSCMTLIGCVVFECGVCQVVVGICFFKQKTAYEMRISDWSSDVCSSDLAGKAMRMWVASLRCHPPRNSGGRSSRNCRPFQNIALGEIGRASRRERVCQYV